MADVSVKMGVSGLSQFKSSMADAQASVKTLDAELKLNEKQLKANGNAEKALESKATLLNQKLQKQKEIVKNAEAALKQMEQNGVKTTSKSYQDMQRRMIEAQAAMLDTENAISTLGQTALDASEKTSKLESSLGGLNKKVSLEQVRSAIGSITSGMEAAGKKALELGKNLLDGVNSVAANADNILTQAMILDMTPEQYQQYKGVFDTTAEITVQEWQKAKLKVQKAINDPSQEQTDVLALLGINTHAGIKGKIWLVQDAARDFEDVFWEIGETLRRKVESGEMTQDLADIYANDIFGRGFAELKPIFDLGKDGFTEALDKQARASEEALKKNAEYADELTKVKATISALEQELISGFTPVLTKAAEAIDGMLTELLEYLKTPEGKQALEDMGKALEGLFGDLINFDPAQAVEGFKKVFDDVVGGVQWLWEHKDDVVQALKFIVDGWAGLKLMGGALDILKLVQGIAGLAGGGAAAAGATAGASWGSAFAGAVLKAAPWLLFLYELLKPGETQDNSLVDANGNLTEEGKAVQAEQQAEEERLANRTDRERWLDAMSAKYNGTMGISAVNMEMFGHDPIYEAIQAYWDKYRTGTATTEDWQALDGLMDDAKWEQFKQVAKFMYSLDRATEDLPYEAFGFNENFEEWLKENGGGMPIVIDPVVPENAEEQIAEDVGVINIPVHLVVEELSDEETAALFGGVGHANGLWSVPFDGYRAILHKGERVVPARENKNYTYNNHNYFGNVNLNNGQDIDALVESIDRHNRRQNAGYGG